MMPAMYSAISGLEAHQTMLNVTANNLANVDTIGFKSQSTDFESELSALVNGGSSQTAGNGGTNPEQYGLGVEVGAIENQMGAGSLESTGNALDVAIQGDGFLAVGNSTATAAAPTAYTPVTVASGTAPTAVTGAATGSDLPTSLSYTQAGNLTTDAQGFLTTQSGQYVMGSTTPGGSPNSYLYIPPGSTNVSIGASGQISYTDEKSSDTTYGQTVTAGYLSLATFSNEAGLTREAGTQWSASPNSGAAQYGTPGSTATGSGTASFASTSIVSGDLEQSNVDMATEFSNMIEAERGYQANSSVISTADQMMQTLIQMAGA
jgi:flagellar hook protein FlgE